MRNGTSHGAMLEQLACNRLVLAVHGWQQVGSSINHNGTCFASAALDNGYEKALRLSDRAAAYDSVGTLIKDIASVIQANTGLSAQQSLLVAGFVLAAGFPNSYPCRRF